MPAQQSHKHFLVLAKSSAVQLASLLRQCAPLRTGSACFTIGSKPTGRKQVCTLRRSYV